MSGESEVRLEVATPADAALLSNLLELYVHDMSEIFPVEIGVDGRFGYAKLPLYWSEPEQRFPFLIRCGARIVGFALVTRGSPATDDPEDLDVAEFFVLRRYRRSGVGRRAAVLLWRRMPGRWIVRVSEGNRGAVGFWENLIRGYTRGELSERERPGTPHAWRVFSFTTPDTAADPGYAIRPARPEDIEALPAVELAAAALLEGHAPASVLSETTDSDDFIAAENEGRLWVAVADDTPIGFALVEMLAPDLPHLEEVDVHPRHGRRGVGSALVRAVCDWARRAGHAELTLTTFRAVAWNMPFYSRLGFEEIPSGEIRPELAAVVRDETERGLDPVRRVAMRYRARAAPGLAGDPASAERNKAVVRAFVEAVNAQDWTRLDAVVAPGFVRHSDAAGTPEVRSRDELKAFLRQELQTFPDAVETLEDVFAEGDRVAARHRFTGTQRGPLGPHPASGARMNAVYIAIYRLEDGRIAEAWAEWDNLAGLIQLGHREA